MAASTFVVTQPSTYKLTQPTVGVPDISTIAVAGTLGAPGIAQLPSVTVEDQLGQIVDGQLFDTTYGGNAKFILLAVPTSTTVTAGLLYTWTGDYKIVVAPTTVASGVASGFPLALAINTVSSNTTSVQYTWFQVQGRGVVLKASTTLVQPNVPLFVSSVTSGKVQTTASSLRTIIGIRSANITTAATGMSALPVYLNFPSIGPGK